MNGFNTLCWGKSHVLANVGSLSGGGGIIPSLSLYVFHHGAVAVQNEDVTEIFSPDIDKIVCDYYDHIGHWTYTYIKKKEESLP